MPAPHPRMHGITHVHGGPDPALIAWEDIGAGSSFHDAVLALATTRDLRGYWRLGEGGFGPYADSKPAGPWVNTPMQRIVHGTAMTDLATGALVTDDDGAVQFNQPNGTVVQGGDWLEAGNVWGTITSNPFDTDIGTVAGWVKPAASSSTFDGGIFSMLSYTGSTNAGYVLGVAWPARTIFHQRGATRLTGPVLAADVWVFVCGVKDATSTRIYVNGTLQATGAAVSGAPGTNIVPSIGLWNHSAWTTPGGGVVYGAIDEVAVWAGVLTDTEIETLYLAGT